jgi:hypothetical protein
MTTSESLSYYQKNALNLIAKNTNEPTEEEIELAKKFTSYGQVDAFKVLKTEQALNFNYVSGTALEQICSQGLSYRTPTEADIILAKRFTDYIQLEALRLLGIAQAELALTFDANSGKALSMICHNKDGSYRTATEADVELAKKFTDYGQVEAFRVLGTEQALEFDYPSGQALGAICQNKDYSYRAATEADIELAKKFTNYGQVAAFIVLGTEQALEFNYPSGQALRTICKNKDYSYRTPTEADIELAKKFTDNGQANALEILGAEQIDLALTFKNYEAEALRAICTNKDLSYRTPTEDDIKLAREFKLDSQVEAIRLLDNATDALKVIYNTQLKKLEEYGKDKFEQVLVDGENEVKDFDSDTLKEQMTQLIKQYNVAEKVCKYKSMLSTKESCLNNKDVFENNKDFNNVFADNQDMDKLAENFADLTIFQNPDVLTSDNPEGEVTCTLIPLMFNAICSGDIQTDL